MKKVISFLLIIAICFICVIPAFAEGDNYYVNETDLSPVTTWLSNIFSKLTDGFSDMVNKITSGFSDLATQFTENVRSITNKVIELGNKIDTALTNLKNNLRDWIVNIRNDITSFMTTVNKLFYDLKDFLEEKINYLFVPTFSFNDKVSEWKDELNDKFPFIDSLKEMVGRITNFKETETAPKFEIEIYGTRVGIIDFSAYALVRKFIQGIILFVSWYTFLRRMYHSIPGFIMSAGDMSARVQDYREEQEEAYWREHGGW